MLIAIIIVLIVRMRRSSVRDRSETYTANVQHSIQSRQDAGLVRNLYNESVESMERNPDIVPQGKYDIPLMTEYNDWPELNDWNND